MSTNPDALAPPGIGSDLAQAAFPAVAFPSAAAALAAATALHIGAPANVVGLAGLAGWLIAVVTLMVAATAAELAGNDEQAYRLSCRTLIAFATPAMLIAFAILVALIVQAAVVAPAVFVSVGVLTAGACLTCLTRLARHRSADHLG